jgi:uncharacterized membrane protein YdcZ (DUF606 family)
MTMSAPIKTAWKAALIGGLIGVFFVLRDVLSTSRYSANLESVLQILGAIGAPVLLFWMGGYAYGLYRQTNSR